MTILIVGPGKQYATLSAAIGASHNGDTIQVQAGTYTDDFATINTNIDLVGVGGMEATMVDRYTKTMLTVIAVCLVWLSVRDVVVDASHAADVTHAGAIAISPWHQ